MTAEIKDGMLIITLPMQTPTPSSTGKTLIVACSHGSQKTSAKSMERPSRLALTPSLRRNENLRYVRETKGKRRLLQRPISWRCGIKAHARNA